MSLLSCCRCLHTEPSLLRNMTRMVTRFKKQYRPTVHLEEKTRLRQFFYGLLRADFVVPGSHV